jgi:serine protease Do
MIRRIVAACLLAGTLISWTPAALAMSPLLREIEASFVRLHEEVRPCVVSIETRSTSKGMEQLDGLFHLFGQPVPEDRSEEPAPKAYATGSGFIYDKQGHIITNNHVVEGAESIKVKLWNGTEFDATVVGQDPETDLAVIKIAPSEDLPVATLGDSDLMKVGQYAIAMGSPRGFEGSLTFGHISALGRQGLQDLAAQGLRFQNLIQTDAGINLGNSGGPLCNIDGEVVGINVAIVWGADSIGFAIPINMAKVIVPQLITAGHVTRGFLGVRIEDAAGGLGESVGLTDGQGAFVTLVQPGTPAETAGVQRYDVVRKVNGEAVADASDLVRKISAQQPGAVVMLEVWRDRQPLELQVTLVKWETSAQARTPQEEPVLGMRLQDLSAPLRERLGLTPDATGVLVSGVVPGSPADEAGLTQGDVLIEVAQQPVASVAELSKVLEGKLTPGASILFGFVRSGSEPDITVLRVPRE